MSILGGWICAYCHKLVIRGKSCAKVHPDKVKCDSFTRYPKDIRSYRNKPKQR
jgi:hypothetical protein